jgi:hypothetical protein
MIAAISMNSSGHQREHGDAFRRGLERHGIGVVLTGADEICHEADFHVIWSIKRPNILAWSKQTNHGVLVAERGHVGDRLTYTSCGWDGLGHRGRYPSASDGGARWLERWGHLMQPWREGGRYALLLGQVDGDAALYGIPGNFRQWATVMTALLRSKGHEVRYRPHPFVRRGGDRFCPQGAALSEHESIAEDLDGAALAVTFNSTSCVEAVLAGVPTVTIDEGAMAWDVASHNLADPLVHPDREAWAHSLAWTQWTLDEIRNGTAWEAVGEMLSAETMVR